MGWLLLILAIPYFFLLLRVFSGLKKAVPGLYIADDLPFVSVIIACKNEEKNILNLLTDLSVQDYPPGDFEVIIADDHSEDSSVQLVSSFDKLNNITLINNAGKGKKEALKTGISLARGELILCTDADCSAGRSWIRTIATFYIKNNKPDMIICPVRLESLPGFFHLFQELEFLSLQAVTAGTLLLGRPIICNGANLAFTKGTYSRNLANLHFDIPTGDDVFLLHSLKNERNGRIMWLESPEAIVTTRQMEDVKSFLRQRRRWISKSGHYHDRDSIVIGIVTFVTILSLTAFFVAGFFIPAFFLIFLAATAIKSIPDYLLLRNTTMRYGRKELIRWFIPCQLAYPFYVIAVIIYFIVASVKTFTR